NLRVQVLRMDLSWGGYVAKKKPKIAVDPDDPAYNWDIYDQFVINAHKHKMAVLFTIYGTPAWASGVEKLNRGPKKMLYLRRFSFAAANRDSNTFKRPDGVVLLAVHRCLVRNGPQNTVVLRPQWTRVGKRNIPMA